MIVFLFDGLYLSAAYFALTCWFFQRKVQEAMHIAGKNPLKGTVEVDEFFVGGPEEGKKGRGNEKKHLVVMAIQLDGFGIRRCYAKVIPPMQAVMS